MSGLHDKATRAAAMYLEHRGYELLDRCWDSQGHAIDLVARDEDAIVMVDVSARREADGGFPAEAPGLRERMEAAAVRWVSEHGDVPSGTPVRFDSIAMVVADGRALIRHHVNALSPAGDLS